MKLGAHLRQIGAREREASYTASATTGKGSELRLRLGYWYRVPDLTFTPTTHHRRQNNTFAAVIWHVEQFLIGADSFLWDPASSRSTMQVNSNPVWISWNTQDILKCLRPLLLNTEKIAKQGIGKV